ncbi:MAG: hypothetical protein ABMB14_39105, partial [Myxococcota bacterium]
GFVLLPTIKVQGTIFVAALNVAASMYPEGDRNRELLLDELAEWRAEVEEEANEAAEPAAPEPAPSQPAEPEPAEPAPAVP